jgi:hypothetical protein
MKKSPLPDAEHSTHAAVAEILLHDLTRYSITPSRNELESRRTVWSGAPRSGQLRPLCYEHHFRMQFSRFIATPDGPKRVHGYICPEPGCLVGYNRREGYFMMVPTRAYTERDIIPSVSCPRDGQLMYLAQTNPDNRSFRLWKCPLCKMIRTNREILTS